MAGATAVGTGFHSQVMARVTSVLDEWTDKSETRVPSICQLCPGGCGLRVRVVGGFPVRIEGNSLHPVNRGALCPRGIAALESLYDPDRFVSPLRRVGPKGSDEWETVSGEEARGVLADALTKLRERGAPQKLGILGGSCRGLIDRMWARFAQAYGTPNYIRLPSPRPDLPDPVTVLMHGEKYPTGYDLRESSFVLSFGCNWLETWNSPVFQLQAYGYMRQGHRGRRAQIAHVEPRLSASAAKADIWVPIKPGTEGILALGLAHLIIREQLYDEDFVTHNTIGFEDWTESDGSKQTGYKRLVLEEFTPVRVSKITGVSPETIVTLARRFATSKPALALGDNRALLEGHDLFTRMAIHSLNVLLGNFGRTGGILPGRGAPPLTVWPELAPDPISLRGLETARLDGAGIGQGFLDSDLPRRLAEAVLENEESPLDVLILHRANPLYGRPYKEEFRKALAKIPLVISLSGVPDEVSQYADLILPEHHFLESWQDDVISHLPGFTLFGIACPTLNPLYDTVNPGDLILDLAHRMGGGLAEAFPWDSYTSLLKDSARGLFESERGYVIAAQAAELLRQVLQRQGYRSPEFENLDDFWEALLAEGAWWEPAEPLESERRQFFTPSGKLEFYPGTLKERLEREASLGGFSGAEGKQALLSALGLVGSEENLFFPRFLLSHSAKAESNGAPNDYPLVLRTYELLTIGESVATNLPSLLENLASHVNEVWESWLEIHPETARELEILNGDWVWVESAKNRVKVKACYYPGLRKDVVAMPVGLGHVAGGRWARGRGVDPSDLLRGNSDPGEGFGIREQLRVRLVRV